MDRFLQRHEDRNVEVVQNLLKMFLQQKKYLWQVSNSSPAIQAKSQVNIDDAYLQNVTLQCHLSLFHKIWNDVWFGAEIVCLSFKLLDWQYRVSYKKATGLQTSNSKYWITSFLQNTWKTQMQAEEAWLVFLGKKSTCNFAMRTE